MVKFPLTEFYLDAGKKWRWRARARNGRIVADCAEAYNSKRAAERGADLTGQAIAGEWRFP